MTSRSSLACLAAGLLATACGGGPTGGAAAPQERAARLAVNYQADVLDTVVGALARAHHADAERLGQDPYGAMVSWVESDRGQLHLIRVELLVHQASTQREGALYAD